MAFTGVVTMLLLFIGYQLHQLHHYWHPISAATALPTSRTIAGGQTQASDALLANEPVNVDDDTPHGDQLRAILVRYFLLAKAHVALMQVLSSFVYHYHYGMYICNGMMITGIVH